ncbi:MAG: sulfotransferase domain-containing protein [Nocardioides sp.]
MSSPPVRYVSSDEDSARWGRFRFRAGDIVISTRSKSGTTWMQMICALLVFGTPELPASLSELSPWLDHEIEPVEDVVRRLEAQRHRRIVKTHTPLDGVPVDPRATYVVVGRHPLDMAVSLYHQSDNIDRDRVAELTGRPVRARGERPSLHDWLVSWTEEETTPAEQMDSLVGVLHHATDAWARQGSADVLLVHYADLLADLDSEMLRIASHLGVDVDPQVWPALVEAASFTSMRARSDELVPNAAGVLKDPAKFFRAGRSGAGSAVLSADELGRYHARVAELAPAEVVAWLHR